MPSGSTKVADVQPENHLVNEMRECDTANLQILSELLHGREFLADTRSIAFDTVSMRVSQLKAIWEHILLPCFELPVVTPQPALKRQQNSPEV